MKLGWEKKKLGEVATYVNGHAFKPEHWGVTGVPIIRIQNLNNLNAEFNYYDSDIPLKFVVENGDILISWSASLGVYEWNRGKAYLNQHIFKVVFNKIKISKYFLKYAVSAKLNEMLKDAHGATMKHIVKSDFDNTTIPYPPIEEQERIVAELDCLSGVIEKKREQLRELDALAQSIFYTMFGDPITNEKGWEVKKLGEVCDIYRGGSPRPIEQYLGGNIPWIKIGDAVFGTDIYLTKTKEHIIEEGLKKTRFIHSGSLIFANCGVSLGFARIITFDGCIHDGWLAFDNISNDINKIFLLKSLNFCTQYFRETAPDGTQPNLNTGIMKAFAQIIPPLALQQEFADKIEAIEKQKALIKQSITQTETLFNARMAYYFN